MQQAYGVSDHAGLFHGIFNDADTKLFHLLGAQCVGMVFVMGWALVFMLPFFCILASPGLFRSSVKDEVLRLDKSFHGGIHPGGDGGGFLDEHQHTIYQTLVDQTLQTGRLGTKQLTPLKMQEFRDRAKDMLGGERIARGQAATLTDDEDPSNSTNGPQARNERRSDGDEGYMHQQ